ncbi:MAG: VOC family protein [Caulobacteraceae bacterium]
MDDIPAAKARLLAAGCRWWRRDLPRCYLADPFGLVFNLGQREGA